MNRELLKGISIFAQLEDHQLRTLAAFACERSVAEGEAIVKQGQFAYEFFAVVAGDAEVQHDGHTIAVLEAGDCFGEIGVLERRLRTATVVARTPMQLITLTTWDVKRLGPGLLADMRELLDRRVSAHAGAPCES